MKINQSKLNQALEVFKKYLAEERAQQDAKERDERKSYFQNLFRVEFNEFTFSEIVKGLWASQMWANQEYLVGKIIRDNGMEKLASAFRNLVFGKGSAGERYEEFLSSIRGMGPSMVTEILCYAEPENAGIWNEKARRALAWLEAEDMPYKKYRISGEEYDEFNAFLKDLGNILAEKTRQRVDLLFVDYFLWEVWDKFAQKEAAAQEEKIVRGASRHDEIRDKIAAIGSWLGFQADTEKTIGPGARV